MIKSLLDRFWKWLCSEIAVEVPGDIDIDGDGPEMPPDDDVEYDALKWCYGGFDGSSAVRSDGVKIVLDSVTSSGLRYHYEDGDLMAVSPSNTHDNPDCLACLFCRVGDEWRGGKFDWISSDRISRDFSNIRTGYHGWPTDAVESADAYAFCIVSKDGMARTNVSVIS